MRPPRLLSHNRDLLLDWLSVVLALALLLVAIAGANRLPYPGAQPYARPLSMLLSEASAPVLSDVTVDDLPSGTAAEVTE